MTSRDRNADQHGLGHDPRRRAFSLGLAALPMLPILPLLAACGGKPNEGAPTEEALMGASQSGVLRHPGSLIGAPDFARIKRHIAAGEEPWTDWWKKLSAASAVDLEAKPNPQEGVYRSTNARTMYWDIQRAYCLALCWKLTDDTRYADKAVETLDAWSATLKEVWTKPPGSTDHEDWTGFLLGGIQGHQWAQVGEIMRGYAGWAPDKVERFKGMLLNPFAGLASGWLTGVTDGAQHLDANANWDLAALCGTMAIGIFCDRHDLYLQAYDYYTANNRGNVHKVFSNGSAMRNVYVMHPGHLGQWQESGRDQGHATLGMSLGGVLLEMAWNQGDDLYGLHNNRFLAGAEYVARSNLKDESGNTYPLPFTLQRNPQGGTWSAVNQSFQNFRDGWELIFNHYVNRKGLAAPNVARMIPLCEQNFWSGNGDDMVFPTLTHRRAAYAGPVQAPSGLTALCVDGKAVLSWWGSVGAQGYRVERGALAAGPFTAIGTVTAGETLTLTDAPAPGIWFYRVVATLADKPDGGPVSAVVRLALPGELRYALPLDDGTGTTAVGSGLDAMGNKLRLDATLASGAAWADGRSGGKALALDGKESYVELPAGLFKDLSDFTISMWAYPNANQWDNSMLFVGQDGTAYMRLVPQSGQLQFSICACTYEDERSMKATEALPTGRWAHVALTLKGSTASLYIGGKLAATDTSIVLSPHQLGDQVRLLGRDTNHASFNGKIADFRVYSGALTADEILALAR